MAGGAGAFRRTTANNRTVPFGPKRGRTEPNATEGEEEGEGEEEAEKEEEVEREGKKGCGKEGEQSHWL